MLRTIWIASIHTRTFMRRYMPTNILIDAVRTRRGLKWGIPAMLLAIPYLYIAATCRTLLEYGGPGWPHLIVLVCIWNALKMLWLGPVSLVLLARTRRRSVTSPHTLTEAQLREPATAVPGTVESNCQ
ncbi:hypothetical protein BAURA86_01771 [Brevibacterium aurantiacum]|uniref:Sulfate permease n=1 Tax=Brevibacterium aurantiacum TaxID=273384 RepID=A0A2H1JJY2_BREAU|nr:hypothetical protein [Brevibacterium aurantiacum]SMX87711.1 hypothetical protein BAURA86_01771 [Brevibacterium aurantiacum]